MTKAKHVHKLKKHKYPNGTAVFFCTLPECGYKVEVPFALGKIVLCNQCGEEFAMNEYTIKLTRPHCNKCGRREVKTSDGRKTYVNKRASDVMEQVAASNVSDLRSRLDSVLGEEDI